MNTTLLVSLKVDKSHRTFFYSCIYGKNAIFCILQIGSNRDEAFIENFMATTTRLDEFYFKLLDNRPEYAEIWHVIKLILVLSHGKDAVESGFSVNGDMLVENLHEASLVAQQIVFDSISNVGGVKEVAIDKLMLQYVRGARS